MAARHVTRSAAPEERKGEPDLGFQDPEDLPRAFFAANGKAP